MIRHRTKPLSKAQKLIDAHSSARRAAMRSNRAFDKLCSKHPDQKHWRSRENCELIRAEVVGFENVARYVPRTAREAGLISRYMIKVLPDQCGGKIFGQFAPKDRAGYELWKTRRSLAICYLEMVVRAFAKAAA